METPCFETEKEARAWIVDDAIRAAVEPYYAILSERGLADLREVLFDATESHPILRLFAGRAGKALVVPVAGQESNRQAARLAGKKELEQTVAREAPPRPHDPALNGMPDLKKPEFYDVTIRVIKNLAEEVLTKSRAPLKGPLRDDLVQEGWLAALKACQTWNESKSAFPTFLWRCVRGRMIDFCSKGANWRDMPAGCVLDTMSDSKSENAGEPIKRFREAMNTAAASFAFGWAIPETPEATLMRVRDHQAARDYVAKLDKRTQDLLELIYKEGMEIAPAGRELGIPAETARRLHNTALQGLHEMTAKANKVRALPFPAAANRSAR